VNDQQTCGKKLQKGRHRLPSLIVEGTLGNPEQLTRGLKEDSRQRQLIDVFAGRLVPREPLQLFFKVSPKSIGF
jgi:hypothetical protein